MISITSRGFPRVDADLAAFIRRLKAPPRLALDQIGREAAEAMRENLETEGQSLGVSWPPLAETTNRDRQARGFPPEHPMLRRTDQLIGSIRILELGSFHVAIGPDDDRAGYLHGRRPFADVTDLDIDRYAQIVSSYYLEGV